VSPVIRIDDEVWAWLQGQARPFEDTPNTVLRRVAGIGANGRAERKEAVSTPDDDRRRLSGRLLNTRWNVHARHALYHREGTWYNNLTRFPGALFDPNGYVIFQTESDYRSNRHVRITQETNVPNGISSMPTYVRKT
jgi:5-methylcytosine-specific restriction protein A